MNKVSMSFLNSASCLSVGIALILSMTACGTGPSSQTSDVPAQAAESSISETIIEPEDSVSTIESQADHTDSDISADQSDSASETTSDSDRTAVPKLTGSPVRHELEFGGCFTDKTIDEFNALGFKYGDSINAEFSNGYVLKDIPYYNGYYSQVNEALLVAYPGYEAVKLCINNGADLWIEAGLKEGDTVDITLNKAAKYLEVQEARDIHYEDDRSLYESDVQFANFRSLTGGKLKAGLLYRSASPCDNQHNRAPYVDSLMKEADIAYILDLADDEEKIQEYRNADNFNSPFFTSLYEDGKVLPLRMNANYAGEEFREKLITGLNAIIENDGPYLIHCTEGKDRTGFVCMFIEAFAGASYDEIVNDYMMTYDNYYGITEETDPEKYSVIVDDVLNPMISFLIGDDKVDIKTADLAEYTNVYLAESGMTEERIAALRAKLTE